MRWTALALVAGVGGVLGVPGAPPTSAAPEGSAAPLALRAHFMDGPPVRSTGGFGEPSCIDCHWGAEVDDPAGSFFLEGVPERFRPGQTYDLALVLTRPGMVVGGFQLSARFEGDGGQAGDLRIPTEAESRMAVVEERDVLYAQQRSAGMTLTSPDTVRWPLRWTAPDGPGPVVFHASGNVGDGDDSQIGDYVYLLESSTQGPPSR